MNVKDRELKAAILSGVKEMLGTIRGAHYFGPGAKVRDNGDDVVVTIPGFGDAYSIKIEEAR